MQDLADHIRQQLLQPLPGDRAHRKMMSYRRPKITDELIARKEPRPSGVLCLLYPRNGTLCITLMQRPAYPGTHGGQVSFPGGKAEPEDMDLIHTAFREANEELGISGENCETLGTLSPVYIPPSNFLVTPVVAVMQAPPLFSIDPVEVEKAFHFPVENLFQPDRIAVERIPVKHLALTIQAPCYRFEEYIIWGATAMILSELQEVIGHDRWLEV